MNDFFNAIDKATSEVDKLHKLLKKNSSTQIKGKDEREVLKSVALAWFHTHRVSAVRFLNESIFAGIDANYHHLLDAAGKASLRTKCISIVKDLVKNLKDLRNKNIISVVSALKTKDTVPDFSQVVVDPVMQSILASRWDECIKCVECNAPLAAIVMMGGLLETLLLAKINKLSNLASVFTAGLAPKNQKGQTLPLNEWTLKNYIEVSHELKWITHTEKDLGVILRDYRNFIHPFKQKTYDVHLQQNDARILWELCKAISKQLL